MIQNKLFKASLMRWQCDQSCGRSHVWTKDGSWNPILTPSLRWPIGTYGQCLSGCGKAASFETLRSKEVSGHMVVSMRTCPYCWMLKMCYLLMCYLAGNNFNFDFGTQRAVAYQAITSLIMVQFWSCNFPVAWNTLHFCTITQKWSRFGLDSI